MSHARPFATSSKSFFVNPIKEQYHAYRHRRSRRHCNYRCWSHLPVQTLITKPKENTMIVLLPAIAAAIVKIILDENCNKR
jgi:hypothetical protein